jgi:hypothetical protein
MRQPNSSLAAKLGLALAEQRAGQALEGLAHRRVWDVALVLVELGGGEQAPRRDERLVSSFTTEDLPMPE